MGLMGSRMALRLHAAGVPLTVWNRDRSKCTPLEIAGVAIAHRLAELADAADVLMICLSDTAAVESLVFGEAGIAGSPGRVRVLIDFSSIDPEASRRFAAELWARCGIAWIDAPVSGGTAGAETGTLTVMAGGEPAIIEEMRPLLAPIAQRVTRMGAEGAGQAAKVCNQMLVACNAAAIAEMMALARRAGVDVAHLAEALAGGFADSLPLQVLAPQMAAHDFALKWRVGTLLKDLRLAESLARRSSADVPMSARARELFAAHAAVHGDADVSTLIGLYEPLTDERRS
jgi:3-hydroxyisobutyrate dehydrogenase